MTTPAKVKIAIGIATAGRRGLMGETLAEIALQKRLPDCVFVCPAGEDDFEPPADGQMPFPLVVLRGPRGAAAQRNTILDAAHDFTVLVFFDDDFFPSTSYLNEVELYLVPKSSVVAVTGCVISDGATGAGISVEEARKTLAEFELGSKINVQALDDQSEHVYSLYGCNMALRLAPIYQHSLRFDEALPLYSWLEDMDFSNQLKPYGDIVRTARLSGVHLGLKSGRTSGVRYGYSQIANSFYLWRKGTCRLDVFLGLVSRNVIANVIKSARPESWIDRYGRVRGNALALADLLRGRLHPQRIFEIT
ncbi:glycosyl transferase, family 2 [Methylocella silvestris BL2]|uniref:Glycosyl transferase, family 2 n=1 Tax=Methylocella silvestris (strain DSM 15510 / CIP 108128 / LMG 27833 / NCIMB 13906 / BL2) TaxID=395965 RepID=B8EM44_METSB|nr:hypothetical protein [Methylocella silvestris]ACK51433.1 glycosyl transferase, family 2 [Methylocella silvestris BL2]